MKAKLILTLLTLSSIGIACSQLLPRETEIPDYVLVDDDPVITATPFQPDDYGEDVNSEGQEESLSTVTPSIPEKLSFAIESSVPEFLVNELLVGKQIEMTDDEDAAAMLFSRGTNCEHPIYAVYVLVAPFPTVRDSVSAKQVESAWAKHRMCLIICLC